METEDLVRMKKGLAACRGCCAGTILWKGGRYFVDFSSGPDNWEIGFEIVYRIVFYTRARETIDKFRTVFKKTFRLPEDHYLLEEPNDIGGSNFWRVYWDRDGLELGLLKKCEKELDQVARANDALVRLHASAIQPRSLEYIRQQVEYNKK